MSAKNYFGKILELYKVFFQKVQSALFWRRTAKTARTRHFCVCGAHMCRFSVLHIHPQNPVNCTPNILSKRMIKLHLILDLHFVFTGNQIFLKLLEQCLDSQQVTFLILFLFYLKNFSYTYTFSRRETPCLRSSLPFK